MINNDGGQSKIESNLSQIGEKLLNGNQSDLRDWFAGMALQGILASGSGSINQYLMDPDIGAVSYQFADRMLKAREE